jgi:hypothetical protein
VAHSRYWNILTLKSPLPWAAQLVFDEAEGLVGRPALGLACSPASNVVEAEPLKGLTAFVNSY